MAIMACVQGSVIPSPDCRSQMICKGLHIHMLLRSGAGRLIDSWACLEADGKGSEGENDGEDKLEVVGVFGAAVGLLLTVGTWNFSPSS